MAPGNKTDNHWSTGLRFPLRVSLLLVPLISALAETMLGVHAWERRCNFSLVQLVRKDWGTWEYSKGICQVSQSLLILKTALDYPSFFRTGCYLVISFFLHPGLLGNSWNPILVVILIHSQEFYLPITDPLFIIAKIPSSSLQSLAPYLCTFSISTLRNQILISDSWLWVWPQSVLTVPLYVLIRKSYISILWPFGLSTIQKPID